MENEVEVEGKGEGEGGGRFAFWQQDHQERYLIHFPLRY